MRHTVWADERVSLPDGAGGQALTWVPRFAFKASIEPITGREQMRANQPLADLDTRITLRWSKDAAALNATWRLRHGSVIYDIKRPPVEKTLGRREIEILAGSGLNQG
jgi:SPP1 family predicted phage head-tail adaptor